ncbi:hypothetical protein CAI21_08740 [Alkalilimnicola ehrlichii]|uniref:N-acetyltransferase domain-containing protein n=2 Tax=Alkalilimnicola ehrlichii TaxID=351052 RepID=A0A3E0WU34_9GAMM|nr:hypothetical protein CAI21_08740 [Alkalilimnicola ehrlichii]RFA36494.1 hypothetical protein CAL65_11015 [Alkalilimnicola ehrlichii]
MDATSDAAALLADENLVESFRQHADWQACVAYREDDGVLLMAGNTPFPILYRNCALRLDATLRPNDAFAQAERFFAAHRRHYSFITRGKDKGLEPVLREAGFVERVASPCMLIEKPAVEPTPPAGVRVERFATTQHVADAVSVCMKAYALLDLPGEEVAAFFEYPERLLTRNVTGFVAYRNDMPLATALTLHSGQSAGVYWVGTTPEAQRQGLAGLCTALATNAGFARGAKVVTLQATSFGAPVYRRLGYKVYDEFKFFMRSE